MNTFPQKSLTSKVITHSSDTVHSKDIQWEAELLSSEVKTCRYGTWKPSYSAFLEKQSCWELALKDNVGLWPQREGRQVSWLPKHRQLSCGAGRGTQTEHDDTTKLRRQIGTREGEASGVCRWEYCRAGITILCFVGPFQMEPVFVQG